MAMRPMRQIRIVAGVFLLAGGGSFLLILADFAFHGELALGSVILLATAHGLLNRSNPARIVAIVVCLLWSALGVWILIDERVSISFNGEVLERGSLAYVLVGCALLAISLWSLRIMLYPRVRAAFVPKRMARRAAAGSRDSSGSGAAR